MARVALTPVKSAVNAGRIRPAGVAGNADGYVISTAGSLGSTVLAEQLLITFTVANAETDVTIKAGDYPPSLAAGQGDLVYAAAVGVHTLGPLESGRFTQDDGSILVDIETAANISAVSVAHIARGQN